MFNGSISQAQNISSTVNYNDNDITGDYYFQNLTIPKKLPEINIDKMANNTVFNNEIITLMIENVQNLLKEIPQYQLPPLFNDYQNLDDKTKFYVKNIVDKTLLKEETNNKKDEQQQQQQQLHNLQTQINQLRDTFQQTSSLNALPHLGNLQQQTSHSSIIQQQQQHLQHQQLPQQQSQQTSHSSIVQQQQQQLQQQ